MGRAAPPSHPLPATHLHAPVAIVGPGRSVVVIEHPVGTHRVAVGPELERAGHSVPRRRRAKGVLGRRIGAVAHNHIRHGQLRVLHRTDGHADEGGIGQERGGQLEGNPHPVLVQLQLVGAAPLVGPAAGQQGVLGRVPHAVGCSPVAARRDGNVDLVHQLPVCLLRQTRRVGHAVLVRRVDRQQGHELSGTGYHVFTAQGGGCAGMDR